jgi:hypothetical protein
MSSGDDRLSTGAIMTAGLAVAALWIATLIVAMERSTYDIWGAIVIGPTLFIVTIPLLSRQARREVDSRVFWLLFLALVAKLFFGTLIRYYITIDVYHGADARSYHFEGVRISELFLHGNFDPGLRTVFTTDFINLATGILYTVIRPTLMGGFFVYSWLAFIGTFYFYRAFVVAVPDGRNKTYARLLFFLPSILYWPSSIGKDAWLMFGLGIAAYGAALVLTGPLRRGLFAITIGLAAAAMVRPHTAAGLAIGLVVAFVIKRRSGRERRRGPIAKVLAFAFLAAVAFGIVLLTQKFLVGKDISGGGVTSILEKASEVTSKGGSSFSTYSVTSPTGLALGTMTVLFRPFVIEASNAQMLGSAIEGAFLLLLTLWRIRWLVAALKGMRRMPYLVVMMAYAGVSIIALSAVGNFGILTRQRTLIFPAYLALLCVPPARPWNWHLGSRRRTVEATADSEPATSAVPVPEPVA